VAPHKKALNPFFPTCGFGNRHSKKLSVCKTFKTTTVDLLPPQDFDRRRRESGKEDKREGV